MQEDIHNSFFNTRLKLETIHKGFIIAFTVSCKPGEAFISLFLFFSRKMLGLNTISRRVILSNYVTLATQWTQNGFKSGENLSLKHYKDHRKVWLAENLTKL